MQSIFCSLFLRRDILICKLPNQDRWRKWTGPLEDHQILGVIADGGRGLLRGCYWAEQTRFAVLDVDAQSKYHSAQELVKLQQKLAAVGLTATPYRSSESGGWHLYIFFNDWAECSEVENNIKAWLKAHAYEIKSGTLEIFPSGNALRLPLQPGFAWLDQEGNVIRAREETTRDEALASFLFALENNSGNWSEAKNRIESQLEAAAAAAGGSVQAHEEAISHEGFEKLFNSGIITEVWEKGRKAWREGLEANGERHDAVLAVGHYLWYGDEEAGVAAVPGARHDEYRARLIEEWLKKKHNGCCRHITEGNWKEVGEQIRRATIWRREEKYKERSPYPLTERLLKRLLAHYRQTGKVWTVEEYKTANEGKLANARQRISEAVAQCLQSGQQISRKTLEKLTGCSPNTLRKHGDLWRLLATGSHVYNRGGRGGSVLFGGSASEKEIFISVLSQGDSGDLELDREDQGEERGALSEDLEQAASLCSAVAPPIHPQAAATRCLVADSATRQPCELAPIVLTPPFLLPGNEPTSEPPLSISLRSLNGCLPSSAEPALGPLHLPLSPIDDGTQVRRFSGRTADGAGGLEPSCNKRQPATISNQTGLVAATRCYLPVNLLPHSVDKASQVQPSWFFRYEASYFDSAWLRSQDRAFWFCRYEMPPLLVSDIYVNSLNNKHLLVLLHRDVRGPPSVNSALLTTFALVSIKYGAGS